MKPKSGWLGLLALLWLVFVFGMYYLGHKPFAPVAALSLGRALAQCLLAAALISLSGGLGRRALSHIETHPLARLTLQAGFGLGIFSLVILLIAGTIGISPLLAWIILALAAVFLYNDVLAWWKSSLILWDVWRASGRYGKAVAICAAIILIATLIIALAPAVKFDALVYHLTLPQQYLERGRLVYLAENIFWGMPQVGEMLYLWGIVLGGDQVAACLGWGVGVLALSGLWGFTSQLLGPAAAWTAVASLLAGYTIAAELSWAYVDWFTILFGLCLLIGLQGWLRSGRASQLVLAGAFAGLAFGSKYSAASLWAAGAIVVLWFSLARDGWRRSLSDATIYSLVGLALMAPWFIKNLVATGNPIYPFIFPAGAMDALRLELYQGLPVWGDWRTAVLLPWEATVSGHEGAPGFSASIGPVLLSFSLIGAVGLALHLDHKLHRLRLAASLAVIGWLIWAVAGRVSGYLIQTRLYLAFFPALGLLAGGGQRLLAKVQLPGVRLGRVASSLVLLGLALNTLQVGMDMLARGAPQFLVGLRSETDYLDANLGWYAPAMRGINNLSPEDKVLMLWEPRSRYCLPRCQPDEILDRWRRDFNTWGEADGILADWRGKGFTYLLWHRAGADFTRQDDGRYPPEAWYTLDELLASLPQVGEFGQVYVLYRLTP